MLKKKKNKIKAKKKISLSTNSWRLGGASLLLSQDIQYGQRRVLGKEKKKRKLFRDVWYVFSRLTRPALFTSTGPPLALIALFYAVNGSRDRDSVGFWCWRRERNRWWWEIIPPLFLHRTSLPWTVLHLSFSQTTDGYKCGAGRLRWWSVFLHISCNFHWIPTNLPGEKNDELLGKFF